MPDLNEKILNLKGEGKSLRAISSILGLSHEAVRRRLKNLGAKNQVSTKSLKQQLTVPNSRRGKVSIGSNARKSRASKETRDTVNQVSTSKTPSLSLNESVNPLGTPSDKLPEAKKGAFPGVLLDIDDLFGTIKEFLEGKGIEVYRMKVESEAYQVEDGGQIIRFYVQRKQTGAS